MANLLLKAPSSAGHEFFSSEIEKKNRTRVAPDQLEDLLEKDIQYLVDILKCPRGLGETSDVTLTLPVCGVR